MSKVWTHNYSTYLKRVATPTGVSVGIITGEGYRRSFFKSAGTTDWVATNSNDTLTQGASGNWTYRRMDDDATLLFDPSGKLLTVTARNGWVTTYTYGANGLLASVSNGFGQTITFYHYDGKLQSITLPGSAVIRYMYNGEFLYRVTYPDNSTRHFHFTHTNNDQLLTGITDENDNRWATYDYDNMGRAIRSELAGAVDRYQVSYPGTNGSSAVVTDPLGTTRTFNYTLNLGKLAVVGADKPDGLGQPDAASRVQSPLGLITAETDFLGTTTSYAWNTDRRLPTAVTEAAGKPEERTTVTEWHPQWRLPVAISESGRTTSYTYDSVGNRLTQTITDTGAGMGSGIARTTTWTYHPSGLVATEKAPNGAVTSYQYDSAGNLTSSTNALGHVDTYTHDAAGRILTHTAPTGLVTTYTYDPRGRMLTVNRGGQLTTLTYRPSGQVATATMPYGHVITYTYDTAQRLTGWSDNRGNSGSYTLDAMGNRTREEVRNAQGQLAWLLVRNINSLNRVQSTAVGGQLTTSYGFDANGETVSSTNGANESTQLGLDGLRRVKTITNAANATASLSYNALDGVVQASDFKGVGTTYARDALGNATGESSPDSGLQSTQYDALGLPSTVTDALGQATSIERDLLGRPTLITQVVGATTTLRYDLSGPAYNQAGQPNASKGSLSEIVDASGTTTYQRDNFGRVTAKTQTLLSGTARSVGYAYASNGLLTSTTYPGGQVLQHVYDATGQITGLNWAGQALVTGITWNPLGQPTGWSWNLPGSSTAIPATRSYNTAGQLTATEFSSYLYNSAGRIYNLTQNLWKPGSTDPLETTLAQADNTWNVQYDSLGRITQMGDGVRIVTYQYDANGNRTSSVRTTVTGTPPVTHTLTRTYGTAAGHNRLLGFEQTAATTGPQGTSSIAPANYQYNTAGDLVGDGLMIYAYNSQGRMESATTGASPEAPKTKYAYNALGQRVFKTEPLYSAAGKPASTKNLNNLLADEDDKDPSQEQPGLIQQLVNFFSKLWSPSTSDAEKLGWTYVYAEDGSLLAEYGEGGAATSGSAQYLWLPTANGPMPIAAVIKGQTFAVHSDHLNTPRKLTQADGQVVWQWAYSAFGDEQPTTAAKRFTSEMTTPSTGSTSIADVTFNLRYPGQYFDKETNLHYNYFRTYAPSTGRYTQGDPIGLDGGWNRFAYVDGNPLSYTDPEGLVGLYNDGSVNVNSYPGQPAGGDEHARPRSRPELSRTYT
jgi:RHS repeat-associated protein